MYLLPEVLHNSLHSSTVSYSCFICNSTPAKLSVSSKKPTVLRDASYIWCDVENIQAVNVDCVYYCTTLETFMATG